MTDPTDGEFLTTGQVAAALGVSRQHVVDLCTRGVLAHVLVGTHRRVRRGEVEALIGGTLTRDAERSLWLHRAVAGRLVVDPDGVLTRAHRNIAHMLTVHPAGMSARWLSRWRKVLDEGVDATLDVLTCRSPEAVELRQNSPFAGVLPDDERRAVVAAFSRHWHRDHAA